METLAPALYFLIVANLTSRRCFCPLLVTKCPLQRELPANSPLFFPSNQMVCAECSDKARGEGSVVLRKLLGVWISRSLWQVMINPLDPSSTPQRRKVWKKGLSGSDTTNTDRTQNSPTFASWRTLLVNQVTQTTVWKTQVGWPTMAAGGKGVYCVAFSARAPGRILWFSGWQFV